MNKIFTLKNVVFTIFGLALQFSFSQTVDEPIGCPPHSIVLTPPTGLNSYRWEFSNGGESTDENAGRIYSEPGNYFVVLKEVEGGPVIGDTVKIQVFEKPELSIEVNKDISCLPANITLTNTTTYPNSAVQIQSYLWDFGDSQGQESISNIVSNNYTRLGSYDVSTQIITNFKSCDIQETKQGLVQVVDNPTVSFNTSPQNLIACSGPLNVNFTNTSSPNFPVTYEWTFGDGTSSPDESPSSKSYTQDGNFPIRLTASYDFGCSSTAQKIVSIGSPDAEITKSAEIDCPNTNVIVSTPLAGAQYRWFINDVLQSTSQTFIPSLPNTGENDIKLILSSADGLCSDTSTTTLVKDDLTINLTPTNRFSCENPARFNYEVTPSQNDVSVQWTFDDGSTSTDETVSYDFVTLIDTFGIELVNTTVMVTNDAGCEVQQQLVDTVLAIKAELVPVSKDGGCIPLEIPFTDNSSSRSPIKNWTFHFGNDSKTITDSSTTHIFTESGEFPVFVIVENELGCKDTSRLDSVPVGDKIEAKFDVNPKKHCWDEVFTYTNLIESDLEYTYSYGSGTGDIEGSVKDFDALTVSGRNIMEDMQTVTYNGCTNDTSTLVIEREVDGAEAIPIGDFSCDDPLVYTFDGSGSVDFNTLQWKIDNVDETTNDGFTKDFVTSGTRLVSLTAQNDEGCEPHTQVLEIRAVVLDVDLSIANDKVCINVPTTLNASNSDFVFGQYFWSFPNNTNVERDTTFSFTNSFIFNQGGNYEAEVSGQDVNGCRDTARINFTVFDMIPTVSADIGTICNPDTVEFTNSSTGDLPLTNWTFAFADGEDTSFTSEPNSWSHIYTQTPITGDNYATILTVTDSLGCQESITLPIVRYAPRSEISVNDTTLCAGDSITVSATNGSSQVGDLAFKWDLGVNGTSTDQLNNITFNSEGTKTISLFVTEDGSNCPADDTIKATIQVQEYPTASYTTSVDGDLVLCAPQLVKFTETSTGTSLISSWDFGDDANGAIITKDPINTFQKGKFTTEYIVNTSFGCADTLLREFDIQGPEGELSVNKTSPVCQGESLDFTLSNVADVDSLFWDFGDGTLTNTDGSISSLSHTYSTFSASGFPVTLVLESNSGCKSPRTLNIPIIDVVADFTINGDTVASSCVENALLNIVDKSINADTYVWNFGNGIGSNAPGNTQVEFTEPGVYTLQLVVDNNTVNCVDTLQRTFTVFSVPELIVQNDTACFGDSLQLNILNPVASSSYKWQSGEFLNSDTIINPTVDVTRTTLFPVMVTDSNSCTNIDTAFAFVIRDDAISGLDTIIVIGDTVTLPVTESNIRNFIWTPDTLLSCLDCDHPTVRPLETITYNLNVTDNLNCFDLDFPFNITVRPETFVKLPTTFSPNNDNNNDIVFVEGWGIKELISFEIYNRWGELIHKSTDLEEGWDGKYKGITQNSDAYVYKVTVLDWRDKTIQSEGYINLIH